MFVYYNLKPQVLEHIISGYQIADTSSHKRLQYFQQMFTEGSATSNIKSSTREANLASTLFGYFRIKIVTSFLSHAPRQNVILFLVQV
jgi:hypothetical protein